MDSKVEQALSLRKAGQLAASNRLFIALVKDDPTNAYLLYQCAWSYDAMGDESQAVPYYEKAIAAGLSDDDLQGAIIGLGSTFRTLGNYEKSKEILMQGVDLFPTNKAIQVFLAMTLYNLQDHHRSMELLLKALIETTENEELVAYKNAISYYSSRMDETWK